MMTTYMYGEDPAEAMDSAAARLALGERSAEMRSYPYGRAPWGVRADGPKHERLLAGGDKYALNFATSLTDGFAAVTTYQQSAIGVGVSAQPPTTGITPRTLEMLREIREAVRVYDRAVLNATIERNGAVSAIERKYL